MKITFESSSEEQEKIMEFFENEVSKFPIKSIEDLYEIITNIRSFILIDAEESMLTNCTKCIENALENSNVYQALIEQFDNNEHELAEIIENYKLSKDDDFINKWNDLIKKKQYLIINNLYKS